MKDERKIVLSRTSVIPASAPGQSTESDYDEYFGIERADAELADWSQTCVSVTRTLLTDLDESRLSTEDKLDIVRGLLIMNATTVERWADAADGGGGARGVVIT